MCCKTRHTSCQVASGIAAGRYTCTHSAALRPHPFPSCALCPSALNLCALGPSPCSLPFISHFPSSPVVFICRTNYPKCPRPARGRICGGKYRRGEGRGSWFGIELSSLLVEGEEEEKLGRERSRTVRGVAASLRCLPPHSWA